MLIFGKIFDLTGTLGLNGYISKKIVDAISVGLSAWSIIALLGTLVASAGLGITAIAFAIAMFERVAAVMGKAAARTAVLAW